MANTSRRRRGDSDDYTSYGSRDVRLGGTWWTQGKEHAGPTMVALAKELWDLDADRRLDWEKNLRRFGGKTLRGIFQGREFVFDRDNVRLNITKSVTETLVAKVGSNRPRPKIITDGANWSLRMRAKKLQKFLDGAYQAADVYTKIVLWFRDALLGGTGVMYFFPNVGEKRVELERVFPLEIVVDPVDAVNGDPETIYRHKFLSKDTLAALFPKEAAEIEAEANVGAEDLPDFWTDGRDSRMLRVVEAWHRAHYSYDGKLLPGKHCIAIGGRTLLLEDYNHTTFPFEFFHWSAPVRGFWGDSAVGEIRGLEKEINRLLQHAQKAMRLAGMPWILKPSGAHIKREKLTNEVAEIIEFDGPQPPTIVSFQVVDPGILQHMWTLYGKAFEILGTNQLQASATKPPGIDSGRALEALSEEHLVRFKHVSKDFEDLVGRKFAAQFVRVARDLDEALSDRGGFVLRAIANKTTLRIKWSEAALSPDEFFLQTWPTSVLPITPAGRTQEVERWQANGWITPERAQELLEFPDLESESNLVTADNNLLDSQLEKMLDEGKAVFPIEEQNFEAATKRATYALEYALTDGTPEDHIDRVRDFLNSLEDLKQAAAAAATMNPLPGLMPPGAAEAMGMGAPPPMPALPPGMPGLPPGMPPM